MYVLLQYSETSEEREDWTLNITSKWSFKAQWSLVWGSSHSTALIYDHVCVRAHLCVVWVCGVCVHVCCAGVCACMCMRVWGVFMLYMLNFDNMYVKRMWKCLGPVQVRHSKYSLLLLLTETMLSGFKPCGHQNEASSA